MILVRCPYCDELRPEEELEFGGEATLVRPSDPAGVSDTQWSGYLYYRDNFKGLVTEQWCCRTGCGQWFRVVRDTATHVMVDVFRLDGTRPPVGTR